MPQRFKYRFDPALNSSAAFESGPKDLQTPAIFHILAKIYNHIYYLSCLLKSSSILSSSQLSSQTLISSSSLSFPVQSVQKIKCHVNITTIIFWLFFSYLLTFNRKFFKFIIFFQKTQIYFCFVCHNFKFLREIYDRRTKVDEQNWFFDK